MRNAIVALTLLAPVLGLAAPTQVADTQRRVVLKSVHQDVVGLNQDGSIPWRGTILAKKGLTPSVGFQSNLSGTIGQQPTNAWTVVPATKSASQAGVAKGYRRYDFVLDKNTIRAGAGSSATWRQLEIQLIPFAAKGNVTYWDHNFPNVASANNPSANYVLRYDLNAMQFQAP